MTDPAILIRTIRRIPGINRVRRWQHFNQDRLYLYFSVSEPTSKTYVDLKCGVVFGFTGQWKYDPNDLGERALAVVRTLCEEYRASVKGGT